MRPERGVRIGSMFSGYGGLEMGVSTALGVGTELAFVADVDPDANKVLTRRYPDVPNLGTLLRLTGIPWAMWTSCAEEAPARICPWRVDELVCTRTPVPVCGGPW